MGMKFLPLFLMLACCPRLHAQILLIAGTPAHNRPLGYATQLLRVNSSGDVALVKELVPRSQGVDWVAAWPEIGKFVILTHDHYSAVVFDTRAFDVVKGCDLTVEGELPLEQWLANVPGRGPSYQALLSYPDGHAVIRSLPLDAESNCDAWLSKTAGPEEIQYIHSTGGGFSALAPQSGGTDGKLTQDNRLFKDLGGSRVEFGVKVPETFAIPSDSKSFIGIAINTDQALMLNYRTADEQVHYLVLRKRDQNWRPIPDDIVPAIPESFGRYIALVETAMKPSISRRLHPKGPPRVLKGLKDAEKSAGADQPKVIARDTGPDFVSAGNSSEYVYNGRLHVYDIETEHVYTIDTKQGNSEILLIENQTVYYRVNDKLYSAEIRGDKLSEPTLLATDEVINDVHWAFTTQGDGK